MSLLKELRFGFRQHRKNLGFTLVVLVTLGLCIGANAAIFTVLDAVLFRPAPYPEPDRIFTVATATRQNGQENVNLRQTGALFEVLRQGAPGLDVAAYSGDRAANFSAGDRPEYVRQQRVSSGFFHVLGIAPQYGREFLRTEDVPGGDTVAVLSHSFWRRVFHGNPAAVGSAIRLQGVPYTVVGIMPRDFRSTVPADVWTPLRPSRTGEGIGTNYSVVARLRPDVSWPEATGQLKALSRNLFLLPGFGRDYSDIEQRLIPFQEAATKQVRRQLWIAWCAVLVVLLIGCVNIAGLLLARSGARYREIATRMALGASRASIVRQLLVESLLLAIGGCVVGLGVGAFALAGLKTLGAESFQSNFEFWRPIQLDARVMLAMLGLATVTSFLFGLVPAFHTARLDIRTALVESGRGIASSGPRWSRNALVVGEVALSLVLLVGAGLLVKTLNYFDSLSPGFDPRHVIAGQATLASDAQSGRYRTREDVERLFTDSLKRVREIRGVQSAAVALTLPYEQPLNYGFRLPDAADRNGHASEMVYVTPAYFETMRIPKLAGRGFRSSDTPESARVVVVSQSFAAKYFRGESAIGHHVAIDGIPREIVGIVGDVQQHSALIDLGPLAVDPTIYLPVSQTSDMFLRLVHTWFPPKWVIRTSGAPSAAIERQLQNAVAAVDPGLAISKFQTMSDLEGVYTTDQRYLAALLSGLAGLAVLLAAVGLYGLISHSIAQRTHELGVRLALGATAEQTIKDVVAPGLKLAGVGIALGFVLSRLAVRFLESMLYGVRPNDAATFLITAAILLVVAFLASAAPALRILRLDPAQTLRNE